MAGNGLFPLQASEVLKAVADAYGLTVDILRSQARQRPVPEARRVAYVLLHDECHLGWPRVGKALGRGSNNSGYVISAARNANPEAVAVLRAQLRPDGVQTSLWPQP